MAYFQSYTLFNVKILRWTFIATGIVVGCATISTKDLMPPSPNLLPPTVSIQAPDQTFEDQDQQLLQLLNSGTEAKNLEWWVNYKRAQLWSQKNSELSCQLYTQLALDNLFPLRPLAYLRAQDTCAADAPELASLGEFKPETFDPWLKDLATDISLTSYDRSANKEKLMNALMEKSKQKLPEREKINHVKRALALAKELNKTEEVKAFEERLYDLAPRLNPEPEPEDFDRVAYDYRRARNFTKARHYYNAILNDKKSSFSKKVSALKGIRKSYKLQRDKKTYLKATRDLADFVTGYYKRNKRSRYFRRVYHDTQITLTRTLWTLNHVTEARKTLINLEKTLRGRYTLAEVFWLRGRMAEEKQKFSEAINWFSKAIADIPGKSEFKEDLLWYKAWNLRKLKRHKEAIESFEELVSISDSPYRRPRYLFWLGRTLSDFGDSVRAHVEFTNLIKEDPIGYYGLLAHHRIQKPVSSPQLARRLASAEDTQKKPEEAPVSDILKPEYIEWLISVDENQVARDYLDTVSANYQKRDRQDEDVWLGLFRYYAESGSYLNLYIQLGKLDSDRRNAILNNHPELVFPRPYLNQVQTASEKYGVSAELVYSIMRQESAFNPNARSAADAFGLLQLLPEIAKKSATKAGVPYSTAEDLFKPHINIPLGSAFIKELWDKYNGQFILAVASYNASDEAISGWLKTRYRGDSLEFIEDIPYEETRGYVRLVMRNLIFYSLLESKEGKIDFPEWCLNIES